MVDDKAHIWLVDPHPKGNGGYNQLQLACRDIGHTTAQNQQLRIRSICEAQACCTKSCKALLLTDWSVQVRTCTCVNFGLQLLQMACNQTWLRQTASRLASASMQTRGKLGTALPRIETCLVTRSLHTADA